MLMLAVVPGTTRSTTPAAAVDVAARAARPNFVVVLVDDMRKDELRWMPRTRQLLQSQGRTYLNALSPHPLCCPARAELLTGEYAQNNGVRHNSGPHGGFDALRGKANTVARWLRDRGYRTGFVGKYLNGYTSADGRQGGWSQWHPLVGGLYDYRHFRFYGEPWRSNDYVTTRISDRTVQMVKDFHASGRPFLIMANHIAPHQRSTPQGTFNPVVQDRYRTLYPNAVNPARAKPSFNEADVSDKPRWIRQLPFASPVKMQSLFLARIRSLKSVDNAVGRLVDTLAKTGELSHTYIFFTSDNGFSLGEHRWTTKDRILDEDLRVPLLVRGPGFTPGSRDDRLTTLLDVPVTIAGLAGAAPERTVDGLSMARATTRDTILVQHGGSPEATNGTQWAWRGVFTARYTYAVNTVNPAEKTLYDRQSDPFELQNLATDPRYADILSALNSRYVALASCSGTSRCSRTFGPLPEPLAEPLP